LISKLDKKQRTIVSIIGAIALLAGFYMLYYEPSQKKIAEIRKDIEAKEIEIGNAKIQVAIFEPLKEQVAEMEEKLDGIKAKTATSGEIIALIKTIEDEAKRLDINVVKMASSVHEPPPPPTTEKGGTTPEAQTAAFTKIILDISLRGKYDKLEDFMETIQHLETFLVVEGLDISSVEQAYPRLTSNMKINLYNEKGVDNNAIAK
jgi:Tfp pilus assembly protein PilO